MGKRLSERLNDFVTERPWLHINYRTILRDIAVVAAEQEAELAALRETLVRRNKKLNRLKQTLRKSKEGAGGE